MESRKQKEREFHNVLQQKGSDGARSSNKFYSVVRRSDAFMKDWLRGHCRNRWALDYGCGDGSYTILMAKSEAHAIGIDISDVSLHRAKESAALAGAVENAHFFVMDCESLAFADSAFDIIVVRAILHHLELDKALAELARVLKKDGQVICIEALADNPLIQLYRRMTKKDRTEWEAEHLLRVKDLRVVARYFGRVDVRFYHLCNLAAVPFRNTRIFERLLGWLEAIDSVVLRVPFVKRMAWQVALVLGDPNKSLVA